MAATKSAPVKKSAASTAAKAPAKKAAPAKKSAAKSVAKAPAKKSATKAPTKNAAKKPAAKAPTKKPVTKAPAKKSVAKAPAKKVATKAPVKKVASKAPAKAPAQKVPNKKAAVVAAAKKTSPVKPVPEKKESVKAPAPVKIVVPPAPQVINPIGGMLPSVRKAVPGKKAAPKHPVVQEDESNWTKTELNAVRKLLQKELAEYKTEIELAEYKFQTLITESGEGAGDDQADAGTKTFEREHEISILSNKRDLFDQTQHALERIEAGTYGRCENCGRQIGKLRLQEANPRATLCMPCREREDRS
ncbi:MAG: TraR/DksA C4-type zinc finger protein [Actinomycetes bacterium]